MLYFISKLNWNKHYVDSHFVLLKLYIKLHAKEKSGEMFKGNKTPFFFDVYYFNKVENSEI